MQRGHGGQRQLHRQEHRDHHDQHHRGAAANHSSAFTPSTNQSSPVGVPLPPVPGLLVGEPEDGQSSEKLTESDVGAPERSNIARWEHFVVQHFSSKYIHRSKAHFFG